jgi:hypothetical protein
MKKKNICAGEAPLLSCKLVVDLLYCILYASNSPRPAAYAF